MQTRSNPIRVGFNVQKDGEALEIISKKKSASQGQQCVDLDSKNDPTSSCYG